MSGVEDMRFTRIATVRWERSQGYQAWIVVTKKNKTCNFKQCENAIVQHPTIQPCAHGDTEIWPCRHAKVCSTKCTKKMQAELAEEVSSATNEEALA